MEAESRFSIIAGKDILCMCSEPESPAVVETEQHHLAPQERRHVTNSKVETCLPTAYYLQDYGAVAFPAFANRGCYRGGSSNNDCACARGQ
jgi:hypothetical protein